MAEAEAQVTSAASGLESERVAVEVEDGARFRLFRPRSRVGLLRSETVFTLVLCLPPVRNQKYLIMEELQDVNVMSSTRGHFLSKVLGLHSVSMVCIYIGMIFFSTYWQKFTKPLELKKILLVYNMMCSFLSLYSTGLFLNGLRSTTSIFQKEPHSELQSAFFIYWLLKNIELLDTIFMILRHKKRQISFLHVYHHCTMVILSELTYRYYPWPAIAPFLTLNSIIHVFLYFYYGQSALNPIQRPAWKQRLTQMQILQFLVDLILAAWGYAFHGFCIYSIFYGFTLLSLFSNFYYKAFIKKKST